MIACRDCPHLQITSRTCSLMDKWLKLSYCYWQRPVIMYCHQHRPIHRPIHIPQLNFRHQRFESMDVLRYHNSGLLLCAMLIIPSPWLGSVTFLSYQDRSARFHTYVYHLCNFVLRFSVLPYSIPSTVFRTCNFSCRLDIHDPNNSWQKCY